jgi:hypothetical protein
MADDNVASSNMAYPGPPAARRLVVVEAIVTLPAVHASDNNFTHTIRDQWIGD